LQKDIRSQRVNGTVGSPDVLASISFYHTTHCTRNHYFFFIMNHIWCGHNRGRFMEKRCGGNWAFQRFNYSQVFIVLYVSLINIPTHPLLKQASDSHLVEHALLYFEHKNDKCPVS